MKKFLVIIGLLIIFIGIVAGLGRLAWSLYPGRLPKLPNWVPTSKSTLTPTNTLVPTNTLRPTDTLMPTATETATPTPAPRGEEIPGSVVPGGLQSPWEAVRLVNGDSNLSSCAPASRAYMEQVLGPLPIFVSAQKRAATVSGLPEGFTPSGDIWRLKGSWGERGWLLRGKVTLDNQILCRCQTGGGCELDINRRPTGREDVWLIVWEPHIIIIRQVCGNFAWIKGQLPTPEPTATARPKKTKPEPTATQPGPTATDTCFPTPTVPGPTATATCLPSPTPWSTDTPTPVPTATDTPLPTATPVSTDTPMPTATDTCFPTPTPVEEDTATPEPTATDTCFPTPTPLPTDEPTAAPTPTTPP